MILLTGHLGYIGSNLLPKLGKGIIVADKKMGIDVSKDFYNKNRSQEFKLIYHLAAQTSVENSFKDIITDIKDNIIATMEIAKFKSKIIFTSTAAVYGDKYNAKETDELNPQSPYAIDKVVAEQIIIGSGNPYVILRIGNVYGKNDSKGVMVKLKEGGKIYGNGTHTRDYVHIDDVIKALLMAKNWKTGIYNIGTGIGISVNWIADMLKVEKVYTDERIEQKFISLDITKALNAGWKSEHNLCQKSIPL